MTDVVYLVRPGDNEELRYSLRSLRNVPHGDVVLVGHCPSWVRGVRHLPVAQLDPGLWKYENATALLREVALRGPDEFALFNDDFFCVSPVGGMPAPAIRGSLRALAAERSCHRSSAYAEMLRVTAAILTESGHPDPGAYTLHTPLTMRRDGLSLTLDYGERHRGDARALSWRSLYGNIMQLGGRPEPDVKVHADEPLPSGPWVSTSDASFRYHRIGTRLRALLDEPSPYEAL